MSLPENRIYLDNNATTRLDRDVADFMSRWLTQGRWLELGCNPASQHQEGRLARKWVEQSRDDLLSLFSARTKGMSSDRLLWTSGGTESNNLAIFGLISAYPGTLIVSSIEHPSVLEAAKNYEHRHPGSVRILPVDSSGIVRVDILEKWLAELATSSKPISVVSIMLANNETGVIQPISEVVKLAHASQAIVHTDAVQGVGKVDINFEQLNVDALSFTAHKVHGPVGIGGLILRSSVQINPQFFGGFQQLGLRPGTESPWLTLACTHAIRLALNCQSTACRSMEVLRDKLESEISKHLPDSVIHGQSQPRLPHTSSIAFPGCDRQALQMALDMAGIACSTGSACASGSSQPSHVLAAMNVSQDRLQSSIRFSLSRLTTISEIEQAVVRIVDAVQKLRQRSMFPVANSVSIS
jgi:cysteine desulfurase